MTGTSKLTRVLACVVAVLVAATLVLPESAPAAKSKVEQLRGELNKINDEAKRAGAAFDKAYWALDETEKAIGETEGRIASNEARLAEVQGLLSDRLVAWYRTDELGFVEFLLGAQSFDDLITRMDYVGRVAGQDSEIIDTVENALTELRADRERLKIEQEERGAKVAALKAERDALQSKLKSKKAEYERVQRELAEAARREAAAAAAAGRAAAAPASGSNAVAGPNGMVFPVAGPNYYSDTWGASRAGGRRRHKGTDIMASTGTPVVATLSGTVSRGNGSTSGLYLRLTADNGWTFYYMHLNSISVGSGRVSAGQTIGTVGYSGNASANAPHLHYEIHLPGRGAVNPYPYLRQMQGR